MLIKALLKRLLRERAGKSEAVRPI